MERLPVMLNVNSKIINMLKYIQLFIIGLFSLIAFSANGETVTLYNDNGEGGIHKTTAKLIVKEGQYYVEMPLFEGGSEIYDRKVYRVKDHPQFVYDLPKWAEKYKYVILSGRSEYYFNMQSPWKPSLTEDPDDPDYVVPVRRMKIYGSDYNGDKEAVKAVLVKKNGKYMIYYGLDYCYSRVERNVPQNYDPAWARSYKYCATISGKTYYFNLD